MRSQHEVAASCSGRASLNVAPWPGGDATAVMRHNPHRVLDQRTQRHRLRVDRHRAGFHLGEVQDPGQQLVQVFGRPADHARRRAEPRLLQALLDQLGAARGLVHRSQHAHRGLLQRTRRAQLFAAARSWLNAVLFVGVFAGMAAGAALGSVLLAHAGWPAVMAMAVAVAAVATPVGGCRRLARVG